MPYIWTNIPSSPPRARRDQVRQICKDKGVRLCGDEIYYDEQGRAYALIELSADVAASEQQDLLNALGAHEWRGLVHADDHEQGAKPLPSGP